jgi:hypothetical protein
MHLYSTSTTAQRQQKDLAAAKDGDSTKNGGITHPTAIIARPLLTSWFFFSLFSSFFPTHQRILPAS